MFCDFGALQERSTGYSAISGRGERRGKWDRKNTIRKEALDVLRFRSAPGKKHRIFCDFGALQERSIGYSEILENFDFQGEES